jgi:hypothetical protein
VPACWQRETHTACLRVETFGGEIHLFPYGQFVTASLGRTEQSETVRITFSSHDVEITGSNLGDLFHALQDFAVKWVRAMPARYQPLGEGDDGLISSVRVTVAN